MDQDFRRALDDLAAADGPRGPLAAHRMVTKRLYEPEHGKFGGPAGVALAERLMQCGSEAALMRLGVRGFITKDTSAAKLADVVRQVHAGGRFIDPEIATDALALGGSPLSTREREVLTLSGEGLRLAEIAGRLCLAEGTVRNYMSSIMNKLDVDNRVAAHRAAREAGWL